MRSAKTNLHGSTKGESTTLAFVFGLPTCSVSPFSTTIHHECYMPQSKLGENRIATPGSSPCLVERMTSAQQTRANGKEGFFLEPPSFKVESLLIHA